MCICQRGLLGKSAEGNLSCPSNPDVQPIKRRPGRKGKRWHLISLRSVTSEKIHGQEKPK